MTRPFKSKTPARALTPRNRAAANAKTIMTRRWHIALIVCSAVLCAMIRPLNAQAIDFYEIQIYPVETTPQGQLQAELHSNTVSTATGSLAHQTLHPYQIHETLEASYGIWPHLEVGQYLCTGRLDGGNYEYAGARTKLHFGAITSDTAFVQLGGNIELDYMRRAAEQNPLTLEIRPIVEKHIGRLLVVADFVFEKPFRGPGTHRGVTFQPSGEIEYQLGPWARPAIEYYGDMGALEKLPGVQRQEHFVVPTLNLDLVPQLEFNLGVGFGVTRASNGVFVKSIIGWSF
jgi:hypothetical protein